MGVYKRDVKYLGQIEIIVTITQGVKIKVKLLSWQFPTVNKECDAESLEQAETIINDYFKKVSELRNKLSGRIRELAEQAYREVLDNGYAELLKSEKFEL